MDFFGGMLQLTNMFLAIIAGGIAISMFKVAGKKADPSLRPWKFLLFALVIYAVLQIVAVLRSFNIFETPFLTHVIVSVLLFFVIIGLIIELEVVRQ